MRERDGLQQERDGLAAQLVELDSRLHEELQAMGAELAAARQQLTACEAARDREVRSLLLRCSSRVVRAGPTERPPAGACAV